MFFRTSFIYLLINISFCNALANEVRILAVSISRTHPAQSFVLLYLTGLEPK